MSAETAPVSAREPFAIKWFRSSNDFVQGFNFKFEECVDKPHSHLNQLGRIAFNSPRLLGGQAARMGISCASCHKAGRSNPDFFIEQISASPGTSDITHSFFSSAGGDNIFNPKPIPDLAAKQGLRFENRTSNEFAAFLHNLIEVEFDGRSTHEPVFNALLHYLNNIDNVYCGDEKPDRNHFEQDWALVTESLILLRNPNLDATAKRFVAESARATLEKVYYNYGIVPHASIDEELTRLSRDLQALEVNTYSMADVKHVIDEADQVKQMLLTRIESSAYTQQGLRKMTKIFKR